MDSSEPSYSDPSPYAPPTTEPPTNRGDWGWKKLLLWGCLGMVGFMGLLVAGCATFLVKRGSEITPACEAYLASAQAGRLQEAYDSAAPALRKALPRFEDFAHFERTVQSHLGPLQSKTRMGVQVFPQEAHLTYNAQFQKGPGTIAFGLVKAGGAWKVQSVNYNSTLLNVNRPCPACGSGNGVLAVHCSACGAALEPGQAPPP